MSTGLEADQVADQDQDTIKDQVDDTPPVVDAADADSTPPVVDADDSAVPPEPEPSPEPETSPEPESSSWITEDHRALAASYGLADAELAGFESPSAFHHHCRLLDRYLASGGQPTPPPPVEPVEVVEPGAAAPAAAPVDELNIDLSRYEGYDDETLQIVKVAKHLQEEVSRMQRERAEEANFNELSRFHDEVDGMDKSLFGGEAKLTAETDARRKTLWEAYHTIKSTAARTAKQDGRPVKLPPIKVLLRRASLFAFGEEVLAAERKANAMAISQQGKRRRPAPGKGKVLPSAAPTQADPKNIRDAAKEIANSPKITALFDSYAEENGNAPQ